MSVAFFMPSNVFSKEAIAANGTGGGAPTQTTRNSGVSVFVVTSDAMNVDVELPANAIEGDLVEFHAINATGLNVCAPSGETVGTAGQFIYGTAGRVFRKATATYWSCLA